MNAEKENGVKKVETPDKEQEEKDNKQLMTEEEISNLDLDSEKVKNLMKLYEEQTDKYAIWRGTITEGFKKWLKGEKIYTREKERISLYVSEEAKADWQIFIKENEISSLSDLIRISVHDFIEDSKIANGELSKLNPNTVSNISHALKEPLTSIKGYSQLLLESDDYKSRLSDQVQDTVRNIFEQSNLLENIIINFLDNIKVHSSEYDILLIEDDLATIRLVTSYFESKKFICKGMVSGTKGLEELGRASPKVILLDIILPDLSGYDICKTIKSDKEYKKIPVYFLTAISGSEVEKHLKETKADGYILKPFNFADFEVILKILNGRA